MDLIKPKKAKSNSIKIIHPIFLALLFAGISAGPKSNKNINELLRSHFEDRAIPITNADDLDPLIEKASHHRLVLLGEASHGTQEFYSWRAEISKRLISEHGFSFIAVEGDWASIFRLNKYVKHMDNAPGSAVEAMQQFKRWPQWMWANTVVAELIEWLHKFNLNKEPEKMVGFYGMDVYGQWEAMDDLLAYAELFIPDHFETIASKVHCFAHFDRDEWMYARATAQLNYSCQQEMEELVNLLADLRNELEDNNKYAYFRAKQNALVVKNAEDYFRLAITGNNDSWNSRVDHMWLSIKRIFDNYPENTQGIVWAHNTHVGDARATSMSHHGMYNIGQLSRGELGENQVFITGFGTNSGQVNAGRRWGSPMQVMRVPNAIRGSLEHTLNQFDHPDFMLVFDDHDKVAIELQQMIDHRAIGVVYDPRNESGNYVPSLFTGRYDAFIFIRKSSALIPVKAE